MKRRKAILIAFLALLSGFIVLERVFLARLKTSVINDDQKIAAFLATLTYPIKIEPGFGFCREGGTEWIYTYQLCVHSGSTPAACPPGSYLLQYLGPQGKFSPVFKKYYESELQFRVPVVVFDSYGNICADRREG